MVRHIRHVKARAHQWIKVHRHRSTPSGPSSTSSARVPALILLVAILTAMWLVYQLTIAVWTWFSINWVGFLVGLLVVTAITIYAQRPGGSR